MGASALAFETTIHKNHHDPSLGDLDDYFAKPTSVGLDNLKKSLRDVILLGMELQGADTGYAHQILFDDNHAGMSISDRPKSRSSKKKKEIQDFWDTILLLTRQMAMSFDDVYEHTREVIDDVKTSITQKIAEIDANIESGSATLEEAELRKQNSGERKLLKSLKRHVKEHEEELKNASSTREVIEVEKAVVQDLDDFNHHRYSENRPKPSNVLGVFGQLLYKAEQEIEASNKMRKTHEETEEEGKKDDIAPPSLSGI